MHLHGRAPRLGHRGPPPGHHGPPPGHGGPPPGHHGLPPGHGGPSPAAPWPPTWARRPLTCGRHDGVDGEAPAPAVHGPVADELPLQLVPRDAQLAGPVAPLPAWVKHTGGSLPPQHEPLQSRSCSVCSTWGSSPGSPKWCSHASRGASPSTHTALNAGETEAAAWP